jgi:hypothetical protein
MKGTKIVTMQALFVILFVCLSTTTALCQDDEDEMRGFFGGLAAGANFAQVTGDYLEGWNKIGANFAAFTYFKLAPQFAGCMEMSYSVKGSRPKSSEVPYPDFKNTTFYKKVGIDLPYAEIPITFNYFYKRESHIGAGLAYGRLFNSKEFYDTLRTETLYPFRKYDVSFVINANLKMHKNFCLNLRFNHSMMNIRPNKNVLMPHRDLQQNKLLGLRVIYLF